MSVWLSWEPSENRTRLHAYTNQCRGCCDTQEQHDRTYAPHSYCGKSWLPWRKGGEAITRDNRWKGTVPECGSCIRVLGVAKLRAKIADAAHPAPPAGHADRARDEEEGR